MVKRVTKRAAGTKNQTATPEFAARLDFEPWDEKLPNGKPPSQEEWERMSSHLITTLRFAYVVLYKTKPELERCYLNAQNDTMEALHRTFDEAVQNLESMKHIVELANIRGFVAASSAALRQEAA